MTGAPARADELRALLLLDGLPGVGPARLRDLTRYFGSAGSALRARRAPFERIAGRDAADARIDPARAGVVDRALRSCERLSIEVVTWNDASYPPGLHHLADPPPVLFLRGRTELLGADAVTVVGSRRATSRARDLSYRLASAVAAREVVVVSGMALGIDGAAHRGALDADGGTVAVLGTGPDVPYPRAHTRLVAQVVERGLVVSEFLPGTPALPHHFPRRNRILAALGAATVVVEAGARSGALITVDHALDFGRDVWAVPGPIERATSAGSNRLLAEGARPLLSVAHFVSEITSELQAATGTAGASGALGSEKGGGADGPPVRRHTRSASAGRAHTVAPAGGEHAALSSASASAAPPDGDAPGSSAPAPRLLAELDVPRTPDEIAGALELSIRDTMSLLTELELTGAVRRLPDMRFRRAV